MGRVRKRVAVVVPMHARDHIAADERVSLRHLVYYLGEYDKYLVVPRSVRLDLPGFSVKHFDDSYFGSAQANTRLMLSPSFYRAFSGYEYILIYHLDALIFSNRLEEWCDAAYDYIGPPWFESSEDPEKGLSRAGNGGFSLRSLDGMRRVITSNVLYQDPGDYWNAYFRHAPRHEKLIGVVKKWFKSVPRLNGARREMSRWSRNEDYFWSDRAVYYHPGFKVAPIDDALRFGFECAPRYCYEMNGEELPFGCHAWERYEPDFWRPWLLTGEESVEHLSPELRDLFSSLSSESEVVSI